jgi:hypothetical protein
MSIEEEAHFADVLIDDALRRGDGRFSVDELAGALALTANSVEEGSASPSWEVSVALVRLTLELYMSGELDETVEGCLVEAVRVLGDSIAQRRRSPGAGG